MDIVDDLKDRSGKTTKMKALNVLKLDQGQETATVFLILMANISSKIAVVMKNAEHERFKIKKDGIFLLKNFQFVESFSGIPVFKVTNKTTVRQSGVLELESLTFTNDEVNSLKNSINSEKYVDVNVILVEPEIVPSGSILSLAQFCKGKPRDLKPNQFVEVNLTLKTPFFKIILI